MPKNNNKWAGQWVYKHEKTTPNAVRLGAQHSSAQIANAYVKKLFASENCADIDQSGWVIAIREASKAELDSGTVSDGN